MRAFVLIFISAIGLAQGQAVQVQPIEPFNTKFVITLWSADAALRAMDGRTTSSILNHPCRCGHELDPIAPRTGSPLAQSLFQASALVGVYASAYLLNKHGHRKLARWVLALDVTSESIAMQNNIRALHREDDQLAVRNNQMAITHKTHKAESRGYRETGLVSNRGNH